MPAAPTPIEPPGRGLLDGKRVVITAAAGTGIGGALARRCLMEGATIVISDAHERRIGETADALGEEFGTRPEAVVCNVTDNSDVQALVSTAVDRMGGIDVWMNNAGLGGNGLVTELTDEEWDRVVDITLTGTFRATRATLRYFGSVDHGGVIVNNASVLGWRAQRGQAPRGGGERRFTVTAARNHSGRLLLSLKEVGDRTAADALRGTLFVIDAADVDSGDDPDEFYDHELEGLPVTTVDGDPVGVVSSVLHLPANDILAVTAEDGRELLVPFVRDIVPEVTRDGGVVIDPPDGLFDQ